MTVTNLLVNRLRKKAGVDFRSMPYFRHYTPGGNPNIISHELLLVNNDKSFVSSRSFPKRRLTCPQCQATTARHHPRPPLSAPPSCGASSTPAYRHHPTRTKVALGERPRPHGTHHYTADRSPGGARAQRDRSGPHHAFGGAPQRRMRP
jgi:hypothetical protein